MSEFHTIALEATQDILLSVGDQGANGDLLAHWAVNADCVDIEKTAGRTGTSINGFIALEPVVYGDGAGVQGIAHALHTDSETGSAIKPGHAIEDLNTDTVYAVSRRETGEPGAAMFFLSELSEVV